MAGSAVMESLGFVAYFANQDEAEFRTTAYYAGGGAALGTGLAAWGRSMLGFVILAPLGAVAGLVTRYAMDANKPRFHVPVGGAGSASQDSTFFAAATETDPFMAAMRGGPWQAADETSFGARVAPAGGALRRSECA